MRVCHVITRMIIGGAQENTLLTCSGLAESGHDVLLLSGSETGPEGSLWDQVNASSFAAETVPSLRRSINPILDLRAMRELTRQIAAFSPDIVHTHSSKAGILGRMAAARAGVDGIVHTIHGMSFNRTQPTWVQACYRSLERWAARKTHAFICVADAMTDQALAAGIGDRSMFHTIRSGMRVERFHADATQRSQWRDTWTIGKDEVVVGTIARLFRNKGYEALLQAMPSIVARDPRVRFVWIGDGPQRSEYTRLLRQAGLSDRVHFTGLVPPDSIPDLLRGIDMLVHASRWEGLPRAVVQALLSEVPAISFDNDGAREVVIPGETGLLVPFGDHEALADAVVELAGDAERRAALGRQGRTNCLVPFDRRTMVTEIERVYGNLLSGRSDSEFGRRIP